MNDDKRKLREDGSWDLSPLYESPEDPRIEEDFKTLDESIKDLAKLLEDTPVEAGRGKELAEVIEKLSDLLRVANRLSAYYGLSGSTDTKASWALAGEMRLGQAWAPLDALMVEIQTLVRAQIADEIKKTPALEPYAFWLEEVRSEARFSLAPEMEELLANVNLYGVSAWSNLQSGLTSSVTGTFRGEEKSLTQIRNLAYDPDKTVRHEAYETELSMYPKIEDSLAPALNSIKGYVVYMGKKRGYESPLDESLFKSRMTRPTLEALIGAMEEQKDVFVRYFLAKAKYLGDEKLHWADLFAPIGKMPSGYSVEDARDMLVKSFNDLHPPIAHIIARAFDENWIDFYPKQGKVGGAFCSNQGELKQSYVLTNFDGSFSAIDTLAHELGHAYHGSRIEDHEILNRSYSMPVAETASTFNETHFLLESLEKTQDSEEKLGLLDGFLMNTSQVINDILSRFLFESEVFDRVGKENLNSQDLQDIMHRAQVTAYGQGLEEDSLNPYMWACKGHYYSAGLSFYNFPYAFGALFAMGLYKKVQEEGPSFMEKYDAMLTDTTISTVEEVGQRVGFDFQDKAFWEESLEAFLPYVEEFEQLVDQLSKPI